MRPSRKKTFQRVRFLSHVHEEHRVQLCGCVYHAEGVAVWKVWLVGAWDAPTRRWRVGLYARQVILCGAPLCGRRVTDRGRGGRWRYVVGGRTGVGVQQQCERTRQFFRGACRRLRGHQGTNRAPLRVTNGLRLGPDQYDVYSREHGEVVDLLSLTFSDRLMDAADVTAHHLHRCKDVTAHSRGLLGRLGKVQFVLVGILGCPRHRFIGRLEDVVSEEAGSARG